ncbi:trigger factor protein [Cystoisospora suis]|uniref:Trigger factor protein n=1 Tax=Cystoisospora suis TaxID=483139 RepID=A0A2C6L5N1_9APIC|nr:trigger factor protein [Cystoisospora suis]
MSNIVSLLHSMRNGNVLSANHNMGIALLLHRPSARDSSSLHVMKKRMEGGRMFPTEHIYLFSCLCLLLLCVLWRIPWNPPGLVQASRKGSESYLFRGLLLLYTSVKAVPKFSEQRSSPLLINLSDSLLLASQYFCSLGLASPAIPLSSPLSLSLHASPDSFGREGTPAASVRATRGDTEAIVFSPLSSESTFLSSPALSVPPLRIRTSPPRFTQAREGDITRNGERRHCFFSFQEWPENQADSRRQALSASTLSTNDRHPSSSYKAGLPVARMVLLSCFSPPLCCWLSPLYSPSSPSHFLPCVDLLPGLIKKCLNPHLPAAFHACELRRKSRKHGFLFAPSRSLLSPPSPKLCFSSSRLFPCRSSSHLLRSPFPPLSSAFSSSPPGFSCLSLRVPDTVSADCSLRRSTPSPNAQEGVLYSTGDYSPASLNDDETWKGLPTHPAIHSHTDGEEITREERPEPKRERDDGNQEKMHLDSYSLPTPSEKDFSWEKHSGEEGGHQEENVHGNSEEELVSQPYDYEEEVEGEEEEDREKEGGDDRDTMLQGPERRHFKERRKKSMQRRNAYLRRGKRFGASAPDVIPRESERVDMRLIEDLASHFSVSVQRSDNATLLIEADIPGHITQKVHELTLIHLRTTLRIPGYRSGLAEVPLPMLQYYAGGPKAVKQRAVQGLGDLLLHQATKQGAKMIGTPQFVDGDEILVKEFTPGQAMKLRLKCDTLPTVKFKTSYKGLELRVPRPPYPEGLIFQRAEEILRKRNAKQVLYSELEGGERRRARMGDAVEVEVTRGWFETASESRGDEIPPHLIVGNVTVILDKDCNPDGGGELVEGLMGVRKGDLRDVRVPLPFSVKEMLPFTGVNQPLSSGSSPPPSPRVSATGFLDTEDPNAGTTARGSTPLTSDHSQTSTADTPVTGNLSVFELLTKEAGQKCGLDVDLDETSQVVDTEEERLVQTILRVKCHGVKKRVQEELDDAFYRELCNMTRSEVRERLEANGDQLVEAGSVKTRRGAVAAALDEITSIEAPETLIEEQGRLTYKQQLRSKEMQGYDVTELDTEEKYQEWKRENVGAVIKLLKTAFTIKAILKNENLQVDRDQLMRSVENTLMKFPGQNPDMVTERTLNLMESQLAYDFVAEHAKLTYYIEERPITAGAVHKGKWIKPGSEDSLVQMFRRGQIVFSLDSTPCTSPEAAECRVKLPDFPFQVLRSQAAWLVQVSKMQDAALA